MALSAQSWNHRSGSWLTSDVSKAADSGARKGMLAVVNVVISAPALPTARGFFLVLMDQATLSMSIATSCVRTRNVRAPRGL